MKAGMSLMAMAPAILAETGRKVSLDTSPYVEPHNSSPSSLPWYLSPPCSSSSSAPNPTTCRRHGQNLQTWIKATFPISSVERDGEAYVNAEFSAVSTAVFLEPGDELSSGHLLQSRDLKIQTGNKRRSNSETTTKK